MALHVGLDPGGTGRKWAYITVAVDGDERLFVGRLREPAIGPEFQPATFPFLNADSIASIENCLQTALRDVLTEIGPPPPEGADPCVVALQRYGGVIASVDAPSGFAVAGHGRRETEANVASNFNTPDEAMFLMSAGQWMDTANQTPLQQRVYWKLVGFTIYRYFLGAAMTAADIGAAASAGLDQNFVLHLPQPVGMRILESFPSHTYGHTGPAALVQAQMFAARAPVNIGATPLPPITFANFQQRLQQFVHNVAGAWERAPGRTVGDCLDAFASMMLGPWAMTVGLHGRGRDLGRVATEGVIAAPQ